MKANFTKRLLANWRNAVMALAMISILGVIDASAQSCYSCTEGSNVTLQDCEAVLTPSHFLGYECDDEAYVLTVTPDKGVSDNGTVSVTVTKPGTYTYTVEGKSNKCWGTFNVEDKSGPYCIVPNGDPDTHADYLDEDDVSQELGTKKDDLRIEKIDCTEDPELYFDVLEIDDFDDCKEVVDVYSTDQEVHACTNEYPTLAWNQLGKPIKYRADGTQRKLNMGEVVETGFDICAIYKRSWYAIDSDGNISKACTQWVYAYRSTATPYINPVVTVSCEASEEEIAAAIAPTIPKFGGGKTILIPNVKVCKYIATVNLGDELPTCGKGYKQLNEWQIIDWCTQEVVDIEDDQIVIVEDITPPIKPTAGSIQFDADPFDCLGKVTAGPASSSDNCSGSNLRWTTTFKIVGIAGVTVLHTNGGSIPGVAIGAEVRVTWTAFDECDNQNSKTVRFTETTDNRAPVAICDDEMNVSLVSTNDGQQARVYAEDVDDTSKDNCVIEWMQVSRDGENYYDYVTFTCEDLGTNIVYLKVVDANYNANICWTEVNIEDKTVPIVIPPADETIYCVDEIPAVGTPKVISEGCQDPTITYEGQDGGGLSCGEGVIKRTWTITPASNDAHTQGEPYTITQTITIKNAPYKWTMMFPKDVELTCTSDGEDPRPDRLYLSDFLIEDNGCEDLKLHFEEKEYYGSEYDGSEDSQSSCFKIVRTYTFANWCAIQERCGSINDAAIPINQYIDKDWKLESDVYTDYFPTCKDDTKNANGDYTIGKYGKIVFTHVIKLNDESVPTVQLTAVPECELSSDCNGGSISGLVTADDNCSDATISSIVLSDNAGVVATINTPDEDDYIFSDLESGIYTVTATVTDACGNVGVASKTVSVLGDCKAPTPVGVAVFTALMETDEVDLWVSDIENGSSYDNCTDYEDLKFGIERLEDFDPMEMPTAQSVTLTCADIPGDLMLWAMDEAGNMTYVPIPVILSDNDNTCNAGVAASIEGRIVNENDIEIDEVMVKFEGTSISAFEQMYNGIFNYSVPMNSDISITPEKDLGYMNGISTADLVKLQRHILGISPLASAYQLIAADVTNDNNVDTRDMLHLSRLILGIYDELPSSNSWRFVAKSHVFANPTSPWGFPETVGYADLKADVQSDFIGIKIADLTGNAKPTNLLGDASEPKVGALNIAIDDVVLEAGTNHTINFTAKDFNDFAGYQFTIALSDKVSMTDLEFGALPNMTEANFGLNRLAQGLVTTSWANVDAISLEDGAVLFSLTVNSTETVRLSEVLNINSDVTAAEAYNNSLEVYGVQAQFNRIAANGFELFQNQPNPFAGETVIGFNMPETGEATLKVMNVAGQVLTVQSALFTKGYNQIRLNKSDLNATGVLYYQIETEGNSATKKMIILE